MSISDNHEQPHFDDLPDRPGTGTGTGTGEPIEKISLRGPVDLVSVIPYLIGFRPGHGDVAIVFTEQGLQACASVARISDPRHLHAMWTSTLATVTRSAPGIDGAYLVAYLGPDADTALQELATRATPLLTHVLRVQAGRLWSLHQPPGAHIPFEGMLIPAETPAFAAMFAAAGIGDLPDRAGLNDCLSPGPPALITETATHLEALSAAAQRGTNDATTPEPAELIDALDREHEARIDGPVPLTSQRAALLLFALQTPDVRDTCLPWCDDAAWWLWTELIRHAPPGWVAPVAALIAATAFRQGRGPQARIAAEHALADPPGSSLAQLVLDIINRGITPQEFTAAIATILTDTDTTLASDPPQPPSPHTSTPQAPTTPGHQV